MAALGFMLRFALRNRLRTAITTLGVGVTLLAFLLLKTVVASWYSVNEEIARSDQFEIRHKISITFLLFKRMEERILAVPGVEEVAALIWFSGTYNDEQTRFGQLAVEGDSYFRIYPEYRASDEQMQAYLADRSGALVGSELASKYGWRIGDRLTLKGTIYPGNWEFTVRAIYPGANEETDRERFYMHYEYVAPQNGSAHRIVVKADPAAAKRIDAVFADSDTPTKTESQLSVQRSWASWSSGVISAMETVGLMVLLVMMLVLGNAMAMATREATRVYATLRAIGYRSRHIMGLVVTEGLLLTLLGAALGIGAGPTAVQGLSSLLEHELGGTWELQLPVSEAAKAVAVALLVAALACGLPAWRAGRLRVAEALRGAA